MTRQPVLEFQNLAIGYRYDSNVLVLLSHISAQLRSGEFVCLVGSNGTGKSTLMRTLVGLQKPISGHIRLMNRNLAKMRRHCDP